MTTRHKAAFTCYLLTIIALAGFGIRYFFATELMPYHAAALGQSLSAMSSNQQITFITLYRAIGTGMLSTALAFAFLLFIPFRRGDAWSRWAMTVVGMMFAGLTLFFTLSFTAVTDVASPWPAAVGVSVLILFAHALASGKARA